MKNLLISLILALPHLVFAGEYIDYSVDGKEYQGYLANANSTKGTVIIIHDWDGLTDYEVKRAEMLADLGYKAFAIDLYGKGNRPRENHLKKAETGKLYNDRAKMRKLILAGIDVAQKDTTENAVVMGYCFGGAAVLELARSGQGRAIKGYASFHGGLSTPEGDKYPKHAGPFFISHGGADSSITLNDVSALAQQLENADADYEIEIYSGAPHAFTVFDTPRYQEKADKKSWRNFKAFLENVLS